MLAVEVAVRVTQAVPRRLLLGPGPGAAGDTRLAPCRPAQQRTLKRWCWRQAQYSGQTEQLVDSGKLEHIHVTNGNLSVQPFQAKVYYGFLAKYCIHLSQKDDAKCINYDNVSLDKK